MSKKMSIGFYCLLAILISQPVFSQTIINYQIWTGASGCNIFSSATNVPATVNGSNSTITHQSTIGQPTYDVSNNAVSLTCVYDNITSLYKGTEYSIAYNFKKDYKYAITINASCIGGTTANLRILPNNGGSGTSTQCNGYENIDPNTSGNLYSNHVINSGTTWTNYTYNYPSFASAQNFLNISAVPPLNSGLQTILIRKITITETAPAPTFTIAPTSVSVLCGSSITQTFIVNNVYNSPGVTSYEWNLGAANNGWLYNGSPAPQNISTTANTLTLTSATCSNILTNVAVTVRMNNADYQTVTSTASITSPALSISGSNTLCSSTGSYSVTGVPCNGVVNWVSSNTNIATVTPSGNPATVTKVGTGSVTITATVNSCGQPVTLSQSLQVGGFGSSDYPITGPSSASCNQYLTFTTNILPGATYYSWFYPGDWTYIDGQGTYMFTVQTPSFVLIGGTYYQVGVRVANACDAGGSYAIQNVFVNSCGYYAYTFAPNPATSTVTVSAARPVKASKAIAHSTISEVNIYDQQGTLKKHQVFGKVKAANLAVTDLPAGVYVIEIIDGAYKERQLLKILK